MYQEQQIFGRKHMSDLREEALGASGYSFDFDEKPDIDKIAKGSLGLVLAIAIPILVVLIVVCVKLFF